MNAGVNGGKHHVVPRRARDRRDDLGLDARLRRENHREPVRAPGGDAALGGSAAKKHVQGGGPRHRWHHGGRRRRDVVAQHARGRAVLRRACDLGGDRRFACRCGAQGAGVVLEPHRRAELGCKARRRDQFDQRPRRQEGRLHQPEVDHRNGDPHRAQARGPRRQGRYPSARRLGPALTALAQGAVAAAPLNDPALTVTPDKYKVLFYAHQYYPKFTWQVAVTTKEFAAKNSPTLRKILKVHRQAVEFVYNNREETARIYAKVWEVSLAEANAILPKCYAWQHWSRGDFSKEGLTAVINGLISVGELKEPFDWGKLIDQGLLDEDLRRPL